MNLLWTILLTTNLTSADMIVALLQVVPKRKSLHLTKQALGVLTASGGGGGGGRRRRHGHGHTDHVSWTTRLATIGAGLTRLAEKAAALELLEQEARNAAGIQRVALWCCVAIGAAVGPPLIGQNGHTKSK